MLRSVALGLALAGCSLVVVRGAPDPAPPPGAPVSCTSSPFGPVVDTIFSAGAATGALYFATSDDEDAKLGVTIETGFAVAFGLSAIYGWRKVGRCRDLQPRS